VNLVNSVGKGCAVHQQYLTIHKLQELLSSGVRRLRREAEEIF
jgi:hypothetical protein